MGKTLRSGYLPSSQRVKWLSHFGLNDGKASGGSGGGYYDAGDSVKFGLPMAFTITMMSWSIAEYGQQLAHSGELHHAMDAVKWGTDYLIKARPEPNFLYGEVGDGNTDHYCWQRPEDMTTTAAVIKLTPVTPALTSPVKPPTQWPPPSSSSAITTLPTPTSSSHYPIEN